MFKECYFRVLKKTDMRKLLVLFLLAANMVFGQQKQMTLRDAILGRYSRFTC